jgi:predicted transcriptional regulator
VVASQKKGRCGHKAVPLDLEQLRNILLKQRMTIEDVSSRLSISKSRIQRYLKKGLLRRHSSSIKPYLTDANKKTRLKWCVEIKGSNSWISHCMQYMEEKRGKVRR